MSPKPETIKIHHPMSSLDEFVDKVAARCEPLFMSDPHCKICIWQEVEFQDGTRGRIVREVPRAEYMAWKDRLFPGRPQEWSGCKFWEMSVD